MNCLEETKTGYLTDQATQKGRVYGCYTELQVFTFQKVITHTEVSFDGAAVFETFLLLLVTPLKPTGLSSWILGPYNKETVRFSLFLSIRNPKTGGGRLLVQKEEGDVVI